MTLCTEALRKRRPPVLIAKHLKERTPFFFLRYSHSALPCSRKGKAFKPPLHFLRLSHWQSWSQPRGPVSPSFGEGREAGWYFGPPASRTPSGLGGTVRGWTCPRLHPLPHPGPRVSGSRGGAGRAQAWPLSLPPQVDPGDGEGPGTRPWVWPAFGFWGGEVSQALPLGHSLKLWRSGRDRS